MPQVEIEPSPADALTGEELVNPSYDRDAELARLEDEVAIAAAELELGYKAKSEIEHYQDIFELYKELLWHNTSVEGIEALKDGASERDVRLLLVHTLVESKRRLLTEAREHEVEESIYEKGKDVLSRSRVARALGVIAVGAILTKLGGGADNFVAGVDYVGPFLATVGASGAYSTLGKFASARIRSNLTEEALSQEDQKIIESTPTAEKQKKRWELQHDHHLVEIEKTLLALAAGFQLQTAEDVTTLTYQMVIKLEESIDDAFQVEKRWSVDTAREMFHVAVTEKLKKLVGLSYVDSKVVDEELKYVESVVKNSREHKEDDDSSPIAA